jgi:hypothetical protein
MEPSGKAAHSGAAPPRERKPELWLADEQRARRASFEAGETIYAQARGLRPSTLHNIVIVEAESRPNELARLITDRHGNLPSTAIVPFFGLLEGGTPAKGLRSFEEAEKALAGREFIVRAEVAEARFSAPRASFRPIVYPCDSTGHLITGFVRGEIDLAVQLRRFPPGCVRVFAVPRQYDWRPGDPIEPVHDTAGKPLVETVRIKEDGVALIRFRSRQQVPAGSYQFIARHFVPGWYNADYDRLLAEDVVSNRRVASLVVRLPGQLAGLIENGVVLTPEIAGRPMPHRPYFQFLNNFLDWNRCVRGAGPWSTAAEHQNNQSGNLRHCPQIRSGLEREQRPC